MTATNLTDLSVAELQEILKTKQEEENKVKKQKRLDYEANKEQLINTLGDFACIVRDQMADLKCEAFQQMAKFRLEMLDYGDIKGGDKNKGSFSLKNDNYKIEFSSQVNKCYDERAGLAETKLKEFLASFVKKKDKTAYEMIVGLLERNSKTGDFDQELINRLYKLRDKFQNPLWLEALDMFQESYSPHGTAQYIKFSSKNPTNNSWESIVLDFAKLKATPNEKPSDDDDQAEEA